MKIAITGGKGTIGSAISKISNSYDTEILDLPDADVRDYDKLFSRLRGKDSVIHLAWEAENENAFNGRFAPDNSLMTYNVYKASLEAGVKRVIMASSVHADNFYEHDGPELMTCDTNPTPTSPDGANKIFMESLGRYYAAKGLEVVCIRFGGINPYNKPPRDYFEQIVWLSHNDCLDLTKKCLEAKTIPDNFSLFYAVSDNEGRVHDFSNPFGWKPKDNAENYL